MKKLLLLVLFFTLFIPLISANMIININPNNPSQSLNHGQSVQIPFSISNDNNFCRVSCTWSLLKNDNRLINSGSQTMSAGSSISIPLTFTAPTKQQVKQDSGVEEYILGVDCAVVTNYLVCRTDIAPTKTSRITINYDLTSDEKNAKSYLQNLLSSIRDSLKILESSIYTLNSKFSTLPKNVLISDLKDQLTGYNSYYSNYKGNYDSTNALYGALSYIEAKNTFNSNLQSSITQLNNNLNSLSSSIEARIKLHNEVTDKLNKLKEDSAKLKLKAKLFNQDVSSLSSQVDSLESTFDAGSFSSYSDIQNRASLLNDQIVSESSKLDQNIVEIIKKGNNFVSSESSKFSLSAQYPAVSNGDIEGIKSLCSQLSSIKSSFEQENNKMNNEYNFALTEINSYNSKLDNINSNIENINQLRDRISEMVNKDNIKDQDYSICQNELVQFSTFNYAQLMNLTLDSSSSCLALNKTLSDLRVNKENSFVFKTMRFFRNLWPFDSVKFEKIKKIEEKKTPSTPKLLDFDSDSKKYSSDYCNLDLNLSVQKTDYVSDAEGVKITNSNVGGITEHENQCCSFDICSKCCEGSECSDDTGSYPVIFLHGHSFNDGDSPEYSLDAFTNLQLALFGDKYRIGGVFRPSDQYSSMNQGEWGKVKFPITVKATYYYNVYSSEGKIINAPSNQESIDAYAQRLKTVVDLVKYRTGRNKVNIVAHSMGGLVARDYIKNYGGDSSVNKLIMVGTPNHGIYGQVDDFCAVLGANTECAQMKADNQFISNLNSGTETYGNVEYYTIAGSGCILSGIDGDGISRVESVQLSGATNVKVSGRCEGWHNRDFHSNLLDSSKYPQTYTYVKQFLQE
ncbi:MAG: alpha/beta hydrolase [Nanoarchaeota archaeon]